MFWHKYYVCKDNFDNWCYSIKWIRKTKHLYWKVIPYDWRPFQIWYRAKCRVWHKYTTVKPRYLPHTWCDRCDLLPNVMFEILSDFIENECNPESVDWYYDGENYNRNKIKRGGKEIWVRDEMQELYDWWHNVYIPWTNNQPELDKWSEYENKHCTDKWKKLENGNFELDPKYDSEESKQQSKLLLEQIWDKEKFMDKELKKNCHRIIRIMDWMWT